MITSALDYLVNGIALFLTIFGLALFLTTPIAIMFGAAHLADNVNAEFGNIAAGLSFILLSSAGLFLTLSLGFSIQEALET